MVSYIKLNLCSISLKIKASLYYPAAELHACIILKTMKNKGFAQSNYNIKYNQNWLHSLHLKELRHNLRMYQIWHLLVEIQRCPPYLIYRSGGILVVG